MELIWEGKYDKNGKRVAPLRVALPFQDVETVNESVHERQLGLFQMAQGQPTEWRNRLIWGDKKYVLPSLLPEFAGKVKLIYIDPPFATGDNFSYSVQVEGEDFTKEPSAIERKAYRDIWGADSTGTVKSLDSYAKWFYETAVLLHELLADDGSIYVHCDYRVAPVVRLIMDDVFSPANFRNEVIWNYRRWTTDINKYHDMHDNIFYYVKTAAAKYNPVPVEPTESVVTRQERGWDQNVVPISGKRQPQLLVYDQEKVDKAVAEGRLDLSKFARIVRREPGLMYASDVWADVYYINSQAVERTGYPTQKPEDLLERIIKASSNPGDLVLDCFSGSGTTAAVAERLGRNWIAADFGRYAIHTARKRLLAIPLVRPFVLQNLGKYERQVWQRDEFGGDEQRAAAVQRGYINFILKLYHAQPLEGYGNLHGLKEGRAVYVGAVDAPITESEVIAAIREWKRSFGQASDSYATGSRSRLTNGIDFLGWEFALNMNETVKQMAAEERVNVRFLTIPREVLEKKAVEQGDIQFFELASVEVGAITKGSSLSLLLNNFVMPPGSVPADVAEHVGKKWDAWIDYWAVDWDYKDDTFHNQWQNYRTRKNRELLHRISHDYDAPGKYCVLVKVIDILGNDTTKTLNIEIR